MVFTWHWSNSVHTSHKPGIWLGCPLCSLLLLILSCLYWSGLGLLNYSGGHGGHAMDGLNFSWTPKNHRGKTWMNRVEFIALQMF